LVRHDGRLADDRDRAPGDHRRPRVVEQGDWWEGDGRLYKGRDEFGATVMDWRSMVYTPAP